MQWSHGGRWRSMKKFIYLIKYVKVIYNCKVSIAFKIVGSPFIYIMTSLCPTLGGTLVTLGWRWRQTDSLKSRRRTRTDARRQQFNNVITIISQ